MVILVEAQLDVNKERYENSLKGGRPRKNNGFQNEKPNVNDNVNVVVNEAAFETADACGGECSPSGITFDNNDKKLYNISQEFLPLAMLPVKVSSGEEAYFDEIWLTAVKVQKKSVIRYRLRSKKKLQTGWISWGESFLPNLDRSGITPESSGRLRQQPH